MNQSGQKFFVFLVILLSSIATAQAQFQNPTPKPTFDVFGGYSGYNPGGRNNGVEFGRLPHGWNSAASVRFTPRYAFIADFGAYSKASAGSTRTYLFGPKFTFHRGPFAPFAQIMMGTEHISPKGQRSSLAFAEAFGGGLDVALAHRWSVRLFQADFIYAANHESTKLMLNQYYGIRVSAGLVWNIGRKHKPTLVAEKSTTPPVTAVSTTEPVTAAAVPTPESISAANATPPAVEVPKTQEVSSLAVAEHAATQDSDPKEAKQKGTESSTVAPQPESAEPSPAEPNKPELPTVDSSGEKPAVEKSIQEKPAEPVQPTSSITTPTTSAPMRPAATLKFPYGQYPTLLSPNDKRTLDAVASRLKLEPAATAVIEGSSDPHARKSAAQRAVNSKDYLVKKGIAAGRIQVFAKHEPPARRNQPTPKTEVFVVPAGASFAPTSSNPVDEHLVKPQHLHVAHPEWHEK